MHSVVVGRSDVFASVRIPTLHFGHSSAVPQLGEYIPLTTAAFDTLDKADKNQEMTQSTFAPDTAIGNACVQVKRAICTLEKGVIVSPFSFVNTENAQWAESDSAVYVFRSAACLWVQRHVGHRRELRVEFDRTLATWTYDQTTAQTSTRESRQQTQRALNMLTFALRAHCPRWTSLRTHGDGKDGIGIVHPTVS